MSFKDDDDDEENDSLPWKYEGFLIDPLAIAFASSSSMTESKSL